jgi:hypothetical protein
MPESRAYIETTPKMTASDFELLSRFIYGHCGIKMPPAKKTMLEARLQKRLKLQGIASFHKYCEYLIHSPDGSDELVHMIDAVTTTKTDFFREPVHFTFLTETAMPEFMNSFNPQARLPLRYGVRHAHPGKSPTPRDRHERVRETGTRGSNSASLPRTYRPACSRRRVQASTTRARSR